MDDRSGTIVDQRDGWDQLFRHEAALLASVFPFSAIHHIGSTAIPGIAAKPVLDMLGVVQTLAQVDLAGQEFSTLGYEVLGEYGICGRRYFRKPDRHGRRTCHLHVYEEGSWHIDRHLAFRDYLIAHPLIAVEYSELKIKLSQLPRVEYQSAKEAFVAQTQADAIAWRQTRDFGS